MRIRFTPLVVVLIALSLASCSSSSSKGPAPNHGGALTPVSARRVLARTVTRNNRANATLSSRLLSSYETGSAFRIDDATYRAERRAHFRPPAEPFGIRLEYLSILRPPSSPAAFVAEGLERSLLPHPPAAPRCGSVYVFERATPAAPWRIALEPATDPGALGGLARTRGGYSPAVSPAARRRARAVAEEVASALMREETTGALGRLRRSDFAGTCWQLPNPRADLEQGESAGYDVRELITPMPQGDVADVPLSRGRFLSLFTLRIVEQTVALSPQNPIVWTHPPLASAQSEAYTYLLRAGRYSDVDETIEAEVAAEVGTTSSDWHLVGGYDGVVNVTGIRTRRSKSTPGTLVAFALRRR